MNVNELRIGNLIYDKHNDIYEVGYNTFSKFFHPTMDRSAEKSFSGIPLTEEWLLSKGFKLIKKGIGWDEFSNSKITLTNVPTNKGLIIAFRHGNDKYVFLKFIHQLQNLYWCLTGEELIINQ